VSWGSGILASETAQLRVTRSAALVMAFVVQVLIGSATFLAFYLATVALAVIIGEANKWADLSAPWLQSVSRYLEMALFAVDLFAFALFIISEVAHFSRALWRGWNDGTG
jgi:hypothetical protein